MNTLAARSVVARFAVAKGEHLFVGRMGGPDLRAGRTDLTGTHKDLRLWEPCKELEIGSEKSSWLVFSEDKINQANGTRTCSMSLRLCELSQTRLGESHVHCADVGTIKKKKTKEMD